MSDYSEKYRDPRWQKKRLEIFKRDDWTCCRCERKDEQLHVHHLCYKKGKPPWDYPDEMLTTLCHCCHEHITELLGELQVFLHEKPLDEAVMTILEFHRNGELPLVLEILQHIRYLIDLGAETTKAFCERKIQTTNNGRTPLASD